MPPFELASLSELMDFIRNQQDDYIIHVEFGEGSDGKEVTIQT